MAFLTDRKRVEGLGSARKGTDHHWSMMISSVALLILIPCFVFTFGATLGGTYEEVLAYYSRPVPAGIAALTLIVGFHHFRMGVTTLIEDYVHGTTKKGALLGLNVLSYGAMGLGVFGIAKLAL